MNQALAVQLRALFAPTRMAPLPTVWSNCLAGWWLGGGATPGNLPLLFAGVTALYLGGVLLNDAFDANFEQRQFSIGTPEEKPVKPSWRPGAGILALGILLLLFTSKTAGAAALLLCAFILLYNATHQFLTASPWLMGACRFWVYLVAGAAGAAGLNGWPIFCGAAMTLYVAGTGYIVQNEAIRRPRPWWPFGLLPAPMILAVAMNSANHRTTALWASALMAAWLLYSLRSIFFNPSGAIVGRLPGNLLAGIVVADWLAIAPGSPWGIWAGMAFFLASTKALQRFNPSR